MNGPHPPPRAPGHSDRRMYRRALLRGLLLSVVAHAALFLLVDGFPVRVPSRDAPDGTARPLADALTVVRLPGAAPAVADRAPEPRSEPRVREPRPSTPVVRTEAAHTRPVALRFASAPAAGGGESAAAGDAGTGAGPSGAGRSEPIPRSLLPQWDPPSAVRGMRVTVRVHVDSSGRPTGPVELDPPTPDEDFNRELQRKVRHMEYEPARVGGNAVPGWAEITFVF